MTGISTKHHGHLTGIVLFTTFILSFSIWFPAGYSVVQINIPQNLILNWIRETQCIRLGEQVEKPSNTTVTNATSSERDLWCSFIREDAMHEQLRENGKLNTIWALIGAAVTIGGTLGVWIANLCINRLGLIRKLFLVTNLLLTSGLVLSSLVVVVESYEIFIIGRIILGAGTGFGSAMSITYIAEITPANFRGALGITPVIAFSIGMLLAAIFSLSQILGTNGYWAYLTPVMFAPTVCFLFSYAFIPESPRWLYNKTRDLQKTMEILQRLRGNPNVQPDIQMIHDEDRAAQQGGRKVSIIGLFRDGFLRYNILICCTAVIAQRLTGYAAVYTYSSGIFRQCGLTKEISAYGTIGLLGLQALAALVGSLLIDKAGRKSLLLTGLFGCTFSLVAMVVFSVLTKYEMCIGCQYGNLAALFVFIIFYTAGAAGVPFILPAEMFGLLSRQSAAALVMMLCQGVTAVVSAVFPVMQVYLLEWTFTVFAGITIVLAVVLACTLTETKRKTFLEIQSQLEKRYYRRHARIKPVLAKISSVAEVRGLPRSISSISATTGIKRLY